MSETSITITLPDAAMTYVANVCTADGWDGTGLIDDYVEKMVLDFFKTKATALLSRQSEADIQAATGTILIAKATDLAAVETAFGDPTGD